ncbi:sensor histidine kinase [Listeria aquatica]|uniref:Sensor histidine kinase n=1 Tax=Listeria aquatica TaxID=1494960 RepID=A0A841ZPS8_9LIST|nr:GHKL domain-containing protein [Listeria aquatica]MBC1521348.1 sensor histidine kinase [Listeria aquatica]
MLTIAICSTVRLLAKKFHWYQLLIRYNKKHTLFTLILLSIFLLSNILRFYFTLPATHVYHFWGILHFLFSFSIVIIAFIIIKEEMQKRDFKSLIQKLREENEISHVTSEFMHDYRATLFSLVLYIKENKNEEALNLLKSLTAYTNKIVKSDFESQISRIFLPSIQSILFQKLVFIQENGITIDLHIPNPINNIYIDEIDYIRILSILIDNASEAAKDAEKPFISIHLTENTIKIENSTSPQNQPLTIQDFTKKNVSTKDGHSGLGLYILSKILRSYIRADFQIESHSQKFIIRIQLGI